MLAFIVVFIKEHFLRAFKSKPFFKSIFKIQNRHTYPIFKSIKSIKTLFFTSKSYWQKIFFEIFFFCQKTNKNALNALNALKLYFDLVYIYSF